MKALTKVYFVLSAVLQSTLYNPIKLQKLHLILTITLSNTIEVIIICFNSLQLLLCVVLVLMTFKDSFQVGCSTCLLVDQSHGAL